MLLAYLSIGAWILMRLETKTELMARSRKLVRLSHLFNKTTADSWRHLADIQGGGRQFDEDEWTKLFR